MRAAWQGLVVEAVDHEIIRIHSSPDRPALGAFTDAHHVTAPVWRLVSGYLGLEARTGAADLEVRSHGHLVARIAPGGDARSATVFFAHPVSSGSDGVWSEGGVAVVPDEGTAITIDGDAGSVVLEGDGCWGAALVHGPAEIKVENRIRLLRSLERVGGRNG